MDIERAGLWSERDDIAVGELWDAYARFPYMPRLTSRDVLERAVSDGAANLNWQQETFAYAEAHDGNSWVDVRTAEHVDPTVGGLIIHPDYVPQVVELEAQAIRANIGLRGRADWPSTGWLVPRCIGRVVLNKTTRGGRFHHARFGA